MSLMVLEPLDARIPKWNLDRLTARFCPFCGTENETILKRPDLLPIAFCQSCQCWYVDKIPATIDIERQYYGYYHTHRPIDLSKRSVSQMLENARTANETDWQLQVLSRLLGGIKGKRILDVGCGWGQFLLMARAAGADVVGCDISPEASEFAQKRLGITVHQSKLVSCFSSIGNVDAVIMRDFLEHPVEPFIDIQSALNVLKSGGFLVLLTPNGGEAGVDVETAKKWVGFRVDLEHLQYLSPHTINWLSKKLDMSIERLEAFGFPGLEGIDKLPKRRFGTANRARYLVKRIPCVRTLVETLRTVMAKTSGEYHDPRLGSYHLFGIFRKG